MTVKRIDVRALEIMRERTTAALNREVPPASDRPFRRPVATTIGAVDLYEAALILHQYMRHAGPWRDQPHDMNAKARALIGEIALVVKSLEKEAAR